MSVCVSIIGGGVLLHFIAWLVLGKCIIYKFATCWDKVSNKCLINSHIYIYNKCDVFLFFFFFWKFVIKIQRQNNDIRSSLSWMTDGLTHSLKHRLYGSGVRILHMTYALDKKEFSEKCTWIYLKKNRIYF